MKIFLIILLLSACTTYPGGPPLGGELINQCRQACSGRVVEVLLEFELGNPSSIKCGCRAR